MVNQGFLREIYKGCKDGYITLNTIPEKETFWFEVTELDKAVKKAAELGKKNQHILRSEPTKEAAWFRTKRQ